ncbi:hypothetical protein [Ruminiclostridium cellulolyticum]|uniref:WYL domain-containing protein n=1 Tax=Ruminiclostridium cellulolyticum (strain ATCC 35319 / DSM 5812 / JCM 6584 / H10) TaxID=394503 RepID=B8I331_RUMCH|nr:hypothetical protein [Ruminiclostridium cellulolyticum]ACL76174.1 hypothetical protein Ccel_1825 [Ruminiclostridium cellulolyticum H10]
MISSEIIKVLSDAIKLRKSVVLKYDRPGDNAKGERIGYPHALYVHTSTNNILFDLFQIQGDSSKPLVAGGDWRQFDVKYVTSIWIKGDIFNVQNGYN